MEIEGEAVIVCKVTEAGALTECRVESETPADFGFGDAALKLVGRFQMEATVDGRALAGRQVRIPMKFMLPR